MKMRTFLPFALVIPCGMLLTGCALPNSGAVSLDTKTVKIVGNWAAVEKTDVEEHVGYWSNADTYVQWPLNALKPGSYEVDAVYSLDPQFAGSTIAVSAAGQTLTKTLGATKNWDDYHPLALGTIKVEKPEDAVLTVKVVNKPPKYVMNLQKVVLTPVAPLRAPLNR